LLLVSFYAGADQYSEAIEQEAERSGIDSSAVAGSSEHNSTFRSSKYDAYMAGRQLFPLGLSQRELKVHLFNEFFEIYANFSELADSKQTEVFQYYQSLQSPEL
jgi:hypothetical protein